jgi:hypothetical protein
LEDGGGAKDGVGECGTREWYMGSVDANSTLALLLGYKKEVAEINKDKHAMFQFVTVYKLSDNKIRMRCLSFYRELAH